MCIKRTGGGCTNRRSVITKANEDAFMRERGRKTQRDEVRQNEKKRRKKEGEEKRQVERRGQTANESLPCLRRVPGS